MVFVVYQLTTFNRHDPRQPINATAFVELDISMSQIRADLQKYGSISIPAGRDGKSRAIFTHQITDMVEYE